MSSTASVRLQVVAPQILVLAHHLSSLRPYQGGAYSTTYTEVAAYLSDPANQIQGLSGVTTRYKPPISFLRCIDDWGGL